MFQTQRGQRVYTEKDPHWRVKIHTFEIVTEISDVIDYHENIFDYKVWFPRFIHRANFTEI